MKKFMNRIVDNKSADTVYVITGKKIDYSFTNTVDFDPFASGKNFESLLYLFKFLMCTYNSLMIEKGARDKNWESRSDTGAACAEIRKNNVLDCICKGKTYS